ncbi:MAG: dTDP-4-dehydrorhamnose 3,5-epimerase [Acidimicrobiales bacterium]
MELIGEPLPGVLHLKAKRFGDDRGWFSETYNVRAMAELGIAETFVQDNQSFSKPVGTVRGLHLQLAPSAQGKLVRVLAGAIFDVAVDVRPGSASYGQWGGVTLSAEEGDLLWVPAGFAHGFCTTMPDTMVFYKVTSLYDPAADRSILWNDPDLGIRWPVTAEAATLSDKDLAAPRLSQADWTN